MYLQGKLHLNLTYYFLLGATTWKNHNHQKVNVVGKSLERVLVGLK